MLFEAIKLARQAILRNTLRSFLTVLGIVIGVGAVIAMVPIGNGTTAKVAADLAKLGSNLLFVRPGQFGPGRASADAKPLPLIGRVSMDLIALDVSALPELAEGDSVTLDYDLPEAADASGLSQYELLTGLSERLERRWA